MSDPRITDEAVEAAAVAACEFVYPPKTDQSWGDVDDWEQDAWRATERVALEAALPHLAPQVVDRVEIEKALRSVLAREGVDEFHDPQPLGWKLADAVIDLLNGTAS